MAQARGRWALVSNPDSILVSSVNLGKSLNLSASQFDTSNMGELIIPTYTVVGVQ